MHFSTEAMLLAIAMEDDHTSKKEGLIHSSYHKEFYHQLTTLEHNQCSQHIPRCALLLQKESPQKRVYNSRSDQALIMLTGLDFATLNLLLATSNIF